MKREAFLGIVIGCLSVASHADQISKPGKGYSFDLPSGWSLDRKEKEFTVRAGTDLSIAEVPTPSPPKGASLGFVSSMTQAAALATGLCGKVTDENIVIKGHKWQGDAFVCNNPKTPKVAAGQVLTLTVKHGDEFRVFALTMPAGTWPGRRDSYVSLLKSLRFGRP